MKMKKTNLDFLKNLSGLRSKNSYDYGWKPNNVYGTITNDNDIGNSKKIKSVHFERIKPFLDKK